MTEFEQLQEELHRLLKLKHEARNVKLLNVGTDHRGEHHWRFKAPSGQILTLTLEIEKP